MVVLRESPWYQEILQQGQTQVVMRQLSRRLGEIPPDLRQQIEGLSEGEIDELLEASLTRFSRLEDLRTWLNQANR
jgi:predicted transposase YdaD